MMNEGMKKIEFKITKREKIDAKLESPVFWLQTELKRAAL